MKKALTLFMLVMPFLFTGCDLATTANSPSYWDEANVTLEEVSSNTEMIAKIQAAEYPTDISSYAFTNIHKEGETITFHQETALLKNQDDTRLYYYVEGTYDPTITAYYKDGFLIGKVENGSEVTYYNETSTLDEFQPSEFFKYFDTEFSLDEVVPTEESTIADFGLVKSGTDDLGNFVITCQFGDNFTRLVIDDQDRVVYRYKRIGTTVTEQRIAYSNIDVTYPEELENWIAEAEGTDTSSH